MKCLEIIPDFLSMYGVFTSQNTSQVRQEMSINNNLIFNWASFCHFKIRKKILTLNLNNLFLDNLKKI